jgi:hypothetical protein
MQIQTPSGVTALVDDLDAALVQKFRWFEHRAKSKVYLRGYKGLRRNGLVYLHHVICHRSPGMEIDHINGDGLDNRRVNFREVDRTHNNANRRFVRGCHFEKRTGMWRAEISKNGTRYRLGRFPTMHDARDAYRAKKAELYPGFYTNEADTPNSKRRY